MTTIDITLTTPDVITATVDSADVINVSIVESEPITVTFDTGAGAKGFDGREIEIQKNSTHIQWRYVEDLTWIDLVLLTDLKGNDGITPVKGIDYFDGINGKSVEIQNNGTHIQWRLIGDTTWINIVALSLLKGDSPVKGVDYFDGTDGREVEFNKSATHIQWRYFGETVWINLVDLNDIKGNDGYTPIKGVDYFDGVNGISWEAITFNTTLNFGNNQRLVYATIADSTMTLTKIIQCFYTDKLDEVAVLNMRVSERNRTAGIGFDIVGVSPDGASGIYPVRIIVSGA